MTRAILGRGPLLGLGILVVVLLADQVTKALVLDFFESRTYLLPRGLALTGFLNLVLVHNTGVSFGLLSNNGPWVLAGLTVVIVLVLGTWLVRTHSRLVAGALGLIIGGAVGNLMDRVRLGAVTDFVDVHAFGYHWPAFNVADSAITVGAVLLILESLFSARTPPPDAPESD